MLRVFPPRGAPRDLAVGRGLTLGRDDGCDMMLPDPEASGRHARLEPAPGGALLKDLGSTNGTRVNGVPVTEQRLAPGDQVEIGGHRIVLWTDAPPAAPREARGAGAWFLVPRGGGERTAVGAGITVGRGETCDVLLSHHTVSTLHARVVPDGRGCAVEDLGSTNGTWVEGKKVRRAKLAHGAFVAFGEVAFRVQDGDAVLPHEVLREKRRLAWLVVLPVLAVLGGAVALQLLSVAEEGERKAATPPPREGPLAGRKSFAGETSGGLPAGFEAAAGVDAQGGASIVDPGRGLRALRVSPRPGAGAAARAIVWAGPAVALDGAAGAAVRAQAFVECAGKSGLAGALLRAEGASGEVLLEHAVGLVRAGAGAAGVGEALALPPGTARVRLGAVLYGAPDHALFRELQLLPAPAGRPSVGAIEGGGVRLKYGPSGVFSIERGGKPLVLSGEVVRLSPGGDEIGWQSAMRAGATPPAAGAGLSLTGFLDDLAAGGEAAFEFRSYAGAGGLPVVEARVGKAGVEEVAGLSFALAPGVPAREEAAGDAVEAVVGEGERVLVLRCAAGSGVRVGPGRFLAAARGPGPLRLGFEIRRRAESEDRALAALRCEAGAAAARGDPAAALKSYRELLARLGDDPSAAAVRSALSDAEQAAARGR